MKSFVYIVLGAKDINSMYQLKLPTLRGSQLRDFLSTALDTAPLPHGPCISVILGCLNMSELTRPG